MSTTSPTAQYFSTRIIHRPPPEAVTYDLTNKTSTTITLPTGSKWSSGLHWHNNHTEYLCVLQGSVKIKLGRDEFVVTAPSPGKTGQQSEDGNENGTTVVVERGVRHEWSRAVIDDGVDVIVRESTDPADGEKTIFFWSVNATVLSGIERIKSRRSSIGRGFEDWLLWWKLMILFWELDNWPVLFNLSGIWVVGLEVESLITWSILAFAALLGILFGQRGVRERDMPSDIWRLWLSSKKLEKGGENHH
jgi:hypothetical protein